MVAASYGKLERKKVEQFQKVGIALSRKVISLNIEILEIKKKISQVVLIKSTVYYYW